MTTIASASPTFPKAKVTEYIKQLNAAAMMNGTDVNMDEISDILKEYQQTLQEGNVSLQDPPVQWVSHPRE